MAIIAGALGMIKTERNKRINKLPGITSLYEIQKIVLCRNAHLL